MSKGLTQEQVEALADQVDTAARRNETIPMLTAAVPEMTLHDAYRIQRASMLRRYRRDERLIGMKMGLTSLAKMRQMGVHEPIYGHLTSTMRLADGGQIIHSAHIHPRVEPEVAFILGHDLRGPVTPSEAMQAVSGVCVALEVLDSRYRDFKFTLIDVVADNASCCKIVLGSTLLPPATIDVSNLGMLLERNGRIEELGSSAAIYEHPARSLAELANMISTFGEWLHAGQIILAGGATRAIAVEPGDHVRVLVEGLGTAELFVRG